MHNKFEQYLCNKIVHNKPVHKKIVYNKAVHNNFTPKLGTPESTSSLIIYQTLRSRYINVSISNKKNAHLKYYTAS